MLLSRNYPPSPALASYIARHYVFSADLPDEFTIVDRLLSETPFIRILLKGDWATQVEHGNWEQPGDRLFFGANSKPMLVRVNGAFHVVGVALRPCAWKTLSNEPASNFADKVMRLEDAWGNAADERFAGINTNASDEQIIAICEAAVTAQLRNAQVNKSIETFEQIARADSTMQIEDVARHLNISTRQLERLSLAYFGHLPKMIMRRSRFLDMATVIRGLGNPSDEYLAALRFFDQSHKSREFKRFVGMTPAEFERTPTPLLTAGLELRHERREAVERVRS